MNKLQEKPKVIRCPNCFNFMNVKTYKNGAYKGICPVCKTVVYSREHSQKETLMRIIKH